MHHAGPRAHALHVARLDDRAGADAVLVLERPLEHVTDDLHIAMPVPAEPACRRDAILVDHTQRSESDVPRIVVVSEGEAVKGPQPAMIGKAAIACLTDVQHSPTPLVDRSAYPSRQSRNLPAQELHYGPTRIDLRATQCNDCRSASPDRRPVQECRVYGFK